MKILPSESVTPGHPDKLADIISDSILDAALQQDPESRVAVEVMVKGFQEKKGKKDVVALGGEITTNAILDYDSIVRNAIRSVGYDAEEKGFNYRTVDILNFLGEQSQEISMGVTATGEKEQGAGDQGLMYGYAVDDGVIGAYMPLNIFLAHALVIGLTQLREEKKVPWLRPDGKSQVTAMYHNNMRLVRENGLVTSVVLAAQHDDTVSTEEVRETLTELVVKNVCGPSMTKDTKVIINGTGRFVTGGPAGDCGLTGRKIIVDTYGGMAKHGGGAFSGKDPSKVDRSANYMGRYIAKNIVAAGLARRCEVAISYCIGVAEPTSFAIDTFGTANAPEEQIAQAVREIFPLKPAEIIRHLTLKKPSLLRDEAAWQAEKSYPYGQFGSNKSEWSYAQTAAFGHFGRLSFPWEWTDKVEDLRTYFRL
ncbi:methionine adenosyltransferase [Candidatus Woesearchaeota archaeon]|nr:methionine adenosyltransferase [Candidatus Woesearchaeota archaeon]